MEKNFIEFGLPAWWILPAIICSVGLSYLLYTKKGVPWGRRKNILLGTLRFLSIFLILLLLLEPLIRQVINEIERPIIVVGIDNSASISTVHTQAQLETVKQQIDELKKELKSKKDFRVEVIPFIGDIDSLSFDAPLSDISKFFRKVEDQFLGEHLSAVVLVTDGIYNRGISPAFRSYGYPVYSLGLGDTIPHRDVAIKEVQHNSVAYAGNEFPVKVQVGQTGFEGQSFDVQLRKGNTRITSERGVLTSSGNEFTFFLSEDEPGLKHYTVTVTRFDEELTHANNSHEIYIELLESKKQVRIAGRSPHPDMRAIRSALEETGNYEVTLDVLGLQKNVENKTYDVQILFDGVDALSGKSGNWIINGSQNGDQFQAASQVSFVQKGRPDQVIPSYNSDFSKFVLNREVARLKRYPPIAVPFGDYTLSGPHEVLLYQQVGAVVTDKPLLAVFDNGNERMAVSMGTGIWQWRLQESASYDDDALFKELVQKLIQFLSISENKKQFRVARGLDVFTEGDVVFFNVEIYDEIFQTLEGQPYAIRITDENESSRSYDYIFGSENKTARVNSFSPGTYRYTATTTIGDKTHTVKGEFLVNALQLEQRSLTADHHLLRRISTKSEGIYYHLNQWDEMKKELMNASFSGIIRSDVNREPFIRLIWVMLLIVGLLSTEWILRKYWGAY